MRLTTLVISCKANNLNIENLTELQNMLSIILKEKFLFKTARKNNKRHVLAFLDIGCVDFCSHDVVEIIFLCVLFTTVVVDVVCCLNNRL